MSYATIATSTEDQALIDRVTAATAQEAWNNAASYETLYAAQVRSSPAAGRSMVYAVAVASDVEAAYASALAAGNPDPGGDEAVITDGMIVANVQAKWPQDEAP